MKISVLLPVYNIENYLAATLASLAEQTFRDFELVCVDDASSDSTPEIMRGYAAKFPALRIIRNETNQRLARTLNIGLKACQGEYIFRLDGDDLLTPDALEKMAGALERFPRANAVVCDRLHINKAGEPFRVSLTLTEDYYLKKNMLFRTAFGGQPCLIERAVWFAAGLHSEFLRAASDRDIGLKMVRHIQIAGLPERLYLYREHAANTTSGSGAYKNSAEFQEHFRRLTDRVFQPEDYVNDWAMVKRHKALDFDYAGERNKKYANTILRCALCLAARGQKKEALAEIKKAEFLAPRINYAAFAALIALGFRDLQKFWVNMNCWFNYAYDENNIVELKTKS
ncbi:MAG: glycosyltransferase family 2 protein [Candidatus Margulisbacteria bacterium]|jgi:glycosyltransferase involved in cell wall biosynthesis|nr:glycosyltransferase family 2 protein [Candidatus Margulisiibacteriota bacterium]